MASPADIIVVTPPAALAESPAGSPVRDVRAPKEKADKEKGSKKAQAIAAEVAGALEPRFVALAERLAAVESALAATAQSQPPPPRHPQSSQPHPERHTRADEPSPRSRRTSMDAPAAGARRGNGSGEHAESTDSIPMRPLPPAARVVRPTNGAAGLHDPLSPSLNNGDARAGRTVGGLLQAPRHVRASSASASSASQRSRSHNTDEAGLSMFVPPLRPSQLEEARSPMGDTSNDDDHEALGGIARQPSAAHLRTPKSIMRIESQMGARATVPTHERRQRTRRSRSVAAALLESPAPFHGSNRGGRANLPTFGESSVPTMRSPHPSSTCDQPVISIGEGGDATCPTSGELLAFSLRHGLDSGDAEKGARSAKREKGAADETRSDGSAASGAGQGKEDAKLVPSVTSAASMSTTAVRDMTGKPLKERLAAIEGVSPTHTAVVVIDVLYVVTALVAACVALEALAVPEERAPMSATAATAILLGCQAFMLLWTATRFFVQTCDGWDVCATAGAIAKVYRRGWLRFDAAVALPLDWPLAWAYPPAFFGLQLRHALRFARFPSLAHSGNPLASSRMSFRLMSQLAIVLFVVHLCAVVYAVVESSSYLSGLYWAVSTTTSVSYGDILPGKTGGSRVLACSAMVAGVAMVAALTAGFTAALTRQDARMQAEDDRKQLLASMLAYYEVPWDEQMELIAMFPAVLDAENRRSFKGLLENLPGFMVEKIEGFAMAKAVTESIPLFRDCERGALSDLTQRLVHRFYRPNEVIVQAGAEGFEMYFLVRGTADVLASLPTGVTAVVATLRNGAFFGEVALVTESCVRTASVVAVTPAEVLVLDKQAYLELVAAHASIGRVFDVVTEQARARAAANQKSAPAPDAGDSVNGDGDTAGRESDRATTVAPQLSRASSSAQRASTAFNSREASGLAHRPNPLGDGALPAARSGAPGIRRFMSVDAFGSAILSGTVGQSDDTDRSHLPSSPRTNDSGTAGAHR